MKINAVPSEGRGPFRLPENFSEHCMDLAAIGFGDTHQPSDEFKAALKAIPDTVRSILEGDAGPKVYISPLDIGVGKTTMVQAVVNTLAMNATPSPETDVGAIICLHRKEQIEDFIYRAKQIFKLPDSVFAVLVQIGSETSDGVKFSELGVGDKRINEAQILLTTQAMVQHRLKYQDWEGARGLYYNNRPRPLRIWDESFALRQDFAINQDQVSKAVAIAGYACPAVLYDWAQDLIKIMRDGEPGSTVILPEIGIPLSAHEILNAMPEDEARVHGPHIESLVALTRVRHAHLRASPVPVFNAKGEPERVPMLLQYEARLPQDILPIIVLDAGAHQKAVYHQQVETVEWLRNAEKRYDDVKVEYRTGSSGRQSFWKTFDDRVQETVADVKAHPDKQVLILHPKEIMRRDQNRIRLALESRLTPEEMKRVNLLHWGKHDSMNSYRECNLIIVHTLFHKPDVTYENMAYATANRPIGKPIEDEEIAAIKQSDLAASVRQGLGRGSLRNMEGDQAQECKIIMYLPQRSPIKNNMRTIYPGISITNTDGKLARDEQTMAFILDRIDSQGSVTFPEIYETLGIAKGNFSTLMRTPAMKAAIQAEGLEVVRSRPNYIQIREKQDGDTNIGHSGTVLRANG